MNNKIFLLPTLDRYFSNDTVYDCIYNLFHNKGFTIEEFKRYPILLEVDLEMKTISYEKINYELLKTFYRKTLTLYNLEKITGNHRYLGHVAEERLLFEIPHDMKILEQYLDENLVDHYKRKKNNNLTNLNIIYER